MTNPRTSSRDVFGKILLLAVAVLASGCVSTQTFKKAQDESAKTISGLQKQVGDLAAKNSTLTSSLVDVNNKLDHSNAALKQTADERDQLKQANEDLSKSLSAKQGELSKTVASLNDQNQDLQQKIALLTKAQEELEAKQQRELAAATSTYQSLMGQLQQEVADGQVKITQIQGKLTVDVADKIFFDSGSSVVKADGEKVLLRVAQVLKQVADKRISIEGHTDNKPMSAALQDKYPSNWELSTARAVNVARFLQEKGGVDPSLLSAVGYGEFHPIASNDTPEGRAQNRRIEIVLLDKEVGKAAQ